MANSITHALVTPIEDAAKSIQAGTLAFDLQPRQQPAKRKKKRRGYQSIKPHVDYPLTAHPSGRWCKKILGKLHYFGPVSDPDAALKRYLEQKDDLLAGRTPRAKQAGGLTLRELANRYLTNKEERVTTGELSRRTFVEYHRTCERLLKMLDKDRLVIDLVAGDFENVRAETAKVYGVIRLGNEIQRIRSLFKFAYDERLIDKPVWFGTGFRRPSLKTLRKQRAQRGPRMFEAHEIRAMLKDADLQLRCMILLGCNCAYGNEDIARLPIAALDLEKGWATFARSKTGVERRCQLWEETVAALRELLARRKEPDKEFAHLVFLTKFRNAWATDTDGNAISAKLNRLLRKLGIKRPRLNFYGFRHSFRTVADGTKDSRACDRIMGHADDSMAGHYIERIDDARLEAVAAHVRSWLFSTEGGQK